MNCFKKIIIASAFLLTTLSAQATVISADETESEVTTSVTETAQEDNAEAAEAAVTEAASVTATPDVTDISEVADVSFTTETLNKYYLDSDYDTDGNATLIKKEKVIYDSEEMQFIAVTTKDGSVFYVLINYTAAGDEDNVFFLNKVDDYDLYALLYAGNEEENNVYDADAAAEAADKANGISHETQDSDSSETDYKDEEYTPAEPAGMSTGNAMIIIIVIGLAALGGIGFFIVNSKKKKKNETIDFEDDGDLDIDEE